MRKLTKVQQEIVDAVAAGARVVHVVWTKTSTRGRGVSMSRRECYELQAAGCASIKLRSDTVERLVRRGLLTVIENNRDNTLTDFVVAVQAGNTKAADRAIQKAVSHQFTGRRQ